MRLKKFLQSSCMGLLAIQCFISNQAEAIFASVKSTGMAATAIAYPQDSMCAAYNPAGIVWVGDRVDTGVAWIHNKGHARVRNNTLPAVFGVNGKFDGMRTKDFYAAEFGICKTYCCDCFDVAVGLVAYNRNFQKTTYNQSLFLFGTSHVGLEYVHCTFAPVIAVRFCDCHSFGIAFDWQVQRLKVNGLQRFDSALFSRHPGHVTNEGYDYSQGFTATFGYRVQLNDCIAVGATYQPKTKMHRFTKYDGFIAGNGRLDVPEKIGAGVSVDIWPCFTVCFDWEYIRWSRVRALSNKLASQLTVDKLGDKDGSGFGFRNQNYYRFGIEYRISECLAIRAGYRHARTPIQRSQTAVNVLTLDCVEDFATVGATWRMNCCNELSFFYAYGFKHAVNGKNVIPPTLFGGDVKLTESKNILALGWGWYY